MRASDVINHLIKDGHPELLKIDGSLNQSELSRRSGITQPTITRIMKNDGYGISENIATKLAVYFNVSKARIRGEGKAAIVDINDEILNMWGALAVEERKVIESLIRTMYNTKKQKETQLTER